MLIGVVNHSSKVTDQDAYAMTLAVGYQARHHASPAWGIQPPRVIYLKPADTPPAGSAVIGILDNADQAGDLGWHTEGPGGVKFGRVFAEPVLANGGNALTDPLSVASVLSHEVLETLYDPACNGWADNGSGTAYAMEVGDPVESDSYELIITAASGEKITAMVSNFVLPPWFDPSPAPGAIFDAMDLLSAPFEVRPTGYVIKMTGGTVTSQFGEQYPEWRRAMKESETARTARRLLEGYQE